MIVVICQFIIDMIVLFGNRFVVIEDRINMLYMLGNRFVFFDRVCKEGSIGIGCSICCTFVYFDRFVYFGRRSVLLGVFTGCAYIFESYNLWDRFVFLLGRCIIFG